MHTLLRIFGIQLKVQCRYSHDGYIQFDSYSLLCKMHWNWGKCFVSCNPRFYILYYQSLTTCGLIIFVWSLNSENVEVSDKIFPDVLSTSRKSCHRQLHSCYSWKGRWCKALFIITIMWVNHLCLISEVQKCRRVHQENSCHWQIHSRYPWRGWWCKALFNSIGKEILQTIKK